MLGGDGGDELFGPRAYLLADRLRAGHPLQALALARELPGAGRPARVDEVARMLATVALAGALPYRLHSARRAPFARRGARAGCCRRTAEALLDSDDPLAWKRLDGPRWWAEVAHGLTCGIEEVGVFEHQRRRAASPASRHAIRCSTSTSWSSACASRRWRRFDRYRNRPMLRAAWPGLLPDAVRLRPRRPFSTR